MGKKVEGKGYMYVGESSWLGGGDKGGMKMGWSFLAILSPVWNVNT